MKHTTPPTPTRARLDFLEAAGFDMRPDPRNIHHLRDSGWTTSEIAEVYGVNERTIRRWFSDPHPCPGERCLVMTPGGRTCHYCRRTQDLEAAA